VVVAGGRVVSKLSLTGTLRWSTTLTAPAASTSIDLAVAADGTIYFLRGDASGVTVHQLSSAGAAGWTASYAGGAACDKNPFSHPLVGAPSGDVALLIKVGSKNVLSVSDATGAARWSKDTLAACRALAVSPAGVYHAAVDDGTGTSAVVLRFTADGTPASSLGKLLGGVFVSLALDAGSNLAAHISSGGKAAVSRTRPDGSKVFSKTA